MAHEINNALEALTNLVYLISTSKTLSTEDRGYAEEALQELARLAQLTRQTLGFYQELTSPVSFALADSVDEVSLRPRPESGRVSACGLATISFKSMGVPLKWKAALRWMHRHHLSGSPTNQLFHGTTGQEPLICPWQGKPQTCLV